MKTKRLLVALICALTLFTSCFREIGRGEIVSEIRNVGNFTEIELTNSADVQILKGNTLKVEVSDYENLIEHLQVETINNKLIIKTKAFRMGLRNSKEKVTITIPDILKSIEISGSGNLIITDDFKGIESFKISGSGNISAISLTNLSNINVEINGSGDIELSGSASNFTSKISGSGNINCGYFETQNATCTISGSGDISIHAVQNLTATISGSGNINYYGNPVVSSTITGSGDLNKKNWENFIKKLLIFKVLLYEIIVILIFNKFTGCRFYTIIYMNGINTRRNIF